MSVAGVPFGTRESDSGVDVVGCDGEELIDEGNLKNINPTPISRAWPGPISNGPVYLWEQEIHFLNYL